MKTVSIRLLSLQQIVQLLFSDFPLSISLKHGPNSHPIKDDHGHHKYVDKYSQSKINHYSKDQDSIILSSGEVDFLLRIVIFLRSNSAAF